MAMITQFTRNEQAVPLNWGFWHVNCFDTAYKEENPTGDFKDLYDPGYTYKSEHTFTDPSDGEVLTILVGDTFSWWWDR